jgi:hypothetical protein
MPLSTVEEDPRRGGELDPVSVQLMWCDACVPDSVAVC